MSEPTVLHVLPHPGQGGERYLDALSAMEGFRFERFFLTEGRGRIEALRGARRARRAAQDADLVHVHGDASVLLCLRILRSRPSVITFHGLHLYRRLGGVRRRLVKNRLRRAIRFARLTICTSDSELRDAAAIAGRAGEGRLVQIDNGIEDPGPPDPERRRAAREELGLSGSDVAVLYVGQLEKRKGVLDLLAALQSARSEGAPLIGLIAGDGPLRDQVERRAEAAGARVLGQRDDVPSLLEAADVFVLPSEREGLSIALLEAMAKGRACVVSDGPGNPDAVGEAGMVFSYGEPEALAGALVKLSGDPSRRASLGSQARARFVGRFTAERMVEKTREAYERALSSFP